MKCSQMLAATLGDSPGFETRFALRCCFIAEMQSALESVMSQ